MYGNAICNEEENGMKVGVEDPFLRKVFGLWKEDRVAARSKV
jgi:hypothetical protein